RVAETEAREQAAAATREEREAASKEQKKADEKEQEEQRGSAAEQMAENNAKMRRINEYLLETTVPAPVTGGQILDDVVCRLLSKRLNECRSGIFAGNWVVKPAYTVFMVIGPPPAGIAAKMPLLQSSVQSNTASGFQRSERLPSSVASIFRLASIAASVSRLPSPVHASPVQTFPLLTSFSHKRMNGRRETG